MSEEKFKTPPGAGDLTGGMMAKLWFFRFGKNRGLARIGSELVPYSVCGNHRETELYSPEVFEYVGQGEIHSINGVVQIKDGEPKQYHFWRKRNA